ncbi:NAD(P)H-hydrate epimerase [Vanrija pseudolonga]|uniref:NAD(P)H-hydrate epimerase n=1 Tax=Vanrija pseudolonga TaxID=143232 RepID=A0AAF1BLI3_9TREE|nr:NAD(P)H-hydrate epimerase [Vanrija pseudolonga]
MSIRYIGQKLAQHIDDELMSASGAFSLDQLMELAGLSCAQALACAYPPTSHRRVLVCCGPGNQGGDGLVAARHLHHFAYTPTIYYPKPGAKEIYQRLVKQARNLDIAVLGPDADFGQALAGADVVLDAIFGFSFQPPVRAPFDKVLDLLAAAPTPIVSVDIPSGWGVEAGRQPLYASDPSAPDGKGRAVATLDPEVLVSLTAPKEGVREFKGRHYLGGRFVPDALAAKYELNLPTYPGTDQVVELDPGQGPKL